MTGTSSWNPTNDWWLILEDGTTLSTIFVTQK